MDYEKRIDFRAFDVLADAIESASPVEIEYAIESCADIAWNWQHGGTEHIERKRLLFKGFANLLRLYQRKHGSKVDWRNAAIDHSGSDMSAKAARAYCENVGIEPYLE